MPSNWHPMKIPWGRRPWPWPPSGTRLGSLHRYPDSHAYYLKEDLARHHGLAPQQLILGNGSDEVLDLLVRALVPPGGEVLSTTHTFLMYGLLTQAVGGFFRPVPLKEMRVDLKAMAQAVTPQTRLIILCNPNNPTGTAFNRQEWEDFLAAVPATATVVLDEAYIDFADDPQVPSCLEYLSEDRPLVGLRTFSKTYGLAGLRIGYGFGPSELMDYLNRLRMPFNVNRLAQAGARAALARRRFSGPNPGAGAGRQRPALPGTGAPRPAVYTQPDQFHAHPGPPVRPRSLSGHAAGRGHHPGHGRLRFPRIYPSQRGTAGGKPAFPRSVTKGTGVGQLSG